ncbi:MAG: sulfurtransferase [Caldilineaceae bacterium]
MKIHNLFLSTLLLILTLLAGCVAPAAPAATDAGAAAQPVDSYANANALVDTAWVAAHLEDETVRLLDIGGNQENYDQGHLPGAIFVNLGADLTNPEDSTQGQILTAEQLTAVMSRLGIENDDTLVLYDANRNLLAARAYWVLKYYQHAGDLHVYNGGSTKWVADGQALKTEAPTLETSQYVAGEADPAIRTTGDYVMEHLDDPSTVLCDTRGPGEFAGTDVRSAQGGHIPGATNVDWTITVNEDGTFKDAAFLSDLYLKAGFTPDKEVITYCQTGVRGAHTWFVLKELLGYPNVRNYDGSWEEWGNDESKPVQS